MADAVFPSLGTHLYDTWFKYTDNVKHEATLMNCLVAESGTGKGCIDEPINHIMADIRERDAVNERREDEYKQECNSKGANKDKPNRPEGLIIQEIHGDMTNAALVTRLDEAEGHFLYVKVNEIQMFDALKGNGKAGHQYMLMCLSFDPNNRYGQTRVGTQSVSKTVCVRLNWNASTTPHKARQYFKSVVEDGPVQRINFITIPEREIGAEQLAFGDYDASFDEALKPYIANLCASRGTIDCPEAIKLIKKLTKECKDIAVLSQSKVFDQLSHRALVIAYLKACVLYVANGCKWEKNIETFVSWSLRNDLWCKIHFFGYMLEQGSDKFANPSRGPKNQLFMLPNVYTLNDLKNVRLKCGMKEEGADVQNRQWLSRGFVTVVTDKKDTYKKLKYLSAPIYGALLFEGEFEHEAASVGVLGIKGERASHQLYHTAAKEESETKSFSEHIDLGELLEYEVGLVCRDTRVNRIWASSASIRMVTLPSVVKWRALKSSSVRTMCRWWALVLMVNVSGRWLSMCISAVWVMRSLALS